MADDGMLLNFELPSDALAPKSSFRGGRWKDRMIAKKTAAWGRQKASDRAKLPFSQAQNPFGDDQNGLDDAQHRPVKRPRVADGRRSDAPPDPREPRASYGAATSSGQSNNQKGVISSLFPYHSVRKPTAAAERPEAVDETPVTPSNAPIDDELATFTKLGLSSTLASHLLTKMNVKNPTGIQRKAVQGLCATHSDAFIQAQTGSGKTLAYLLPIVQQLSEISKHMKNAGSGFNRESGLFAIILAPTRELSKQISSVLETLLSCYPWIVSGSVIGGEKKKSEKARLRKGVNILVATPGRLADHLDHTEVVDVSRVRWLVLDEGDRLMELGFEQDIQKLISTLNLRATKLQKTTIDGLPNRRMTILCSATIKTEVDRLQYIALKEPLSIRGDAAEDTGDTGDATQTVAFSAPAQLRQAYATIPPKQRLVSLVAVLRQAFRRKGSVMKAIVFMSCADSVDFHFDLFTRNAAVTTESGKSNDKTSKTDKSPEMQTSGLASAFGNDENPVHLYKLHGSLPQAVRTSTLKLFTKSADPGVLVCTDVASRGLDLPDIEYVIEYDPPFSKEDHLHRVGRTARAGKDGRALIFLQPGCEEGYLQILKDTQPRSLTGHDADELLGKGFSSGVGKPQAQEWEDKATEWQLDLERWVLETPGKLEQARRAFQSHVRAYTTHIAAERAMFDIKQLHLGHLAKAFALRDRPGDMRVPGLRPGKDVGSKNKESRKRDARSQTSRGEESSRKTRDNDDAVAAEQDGRKTMQAKVRAMMGGASEFNLG